MDGEKLTLGVKLYLQNSPCTYLTSSLLWKIYVLLHSFQNLLSVIQKRVFCFFNQISRSSKFVQAYALFSVNLLSYYSC